MKKFDKPALTINEQVELLVQQGLEVHDQEHAKYVLSVVGYYRLSGYLLPFKQSHQPTNQRQFRPNTKLDTIWQLYQFDRELRLLVSDAIEKIEVAFRSALANVTSIELGPSWYSDKKLHRQQWPYNKVIKDVDQVLRSSHDIFIKHYQSNYTSPKYPPIWMITETLSFGTCSKLFNNIKPIAIRKKIAKQLGQHPTILGSWIHSLTYIRNICAHHGRLWNRWLVNSPMLSKHDPNHALFFNLDEYRFHLIAYVIHQLLVTVAPKSPWREHLYDLFSKYDAFPGIEMGFQKDWKNDPFWDL